MTSALEAARRLLGSNFEQLTGAHVVGEVPLTDTVVNGVIAERLARSPTPVEAVRVHAHEGDALDAHVTLRGVPMISTVPVSARIDQQPNIPGSTVLGLRWSLAGLGALAWIAGPFISRLKTLPPGIRIEGDRVLVDLAEVLRAQGLEELLRYVARIEVHTREGRIVLLFELRA